jgi:hypothetical protein
MKQYIELHANHIINIIKRYHSRFSYKLCPGRRKEIFYLKANDLIYICSYIKECKYANELEKIDNKLHLIIKYKLINDNTMISLNILLENYKDLIK